LFLSIFFNFNTSTQTVIEILFKTVLSWIVHICLLDFYMPSSLIIIFIISSNVLSWFFLNNFSSKESCCRLLIWALSLLKCFLLWSIVIPNGLILANWIRPHEQAIGFKVLPILFINSIQETRVSFPFNKCIYCTDIVRVIW
jgi:hypothetical protein